MLYEVITADLDLTRDLELALHQHQRGGAVVETGGVAGGDRA